MAALNYDSAGGGSYTTLATALAAVAATDDVIYVLSTSNELLSTNTVFSASATYALPQQAQKLYSVDDFSTPALTTGAKITANASITLTFEGNWDFNGVEFYYSGASGGVKLNLGHTGQPSEISATGCKFNILSTSASAPCLVLGSTLSTVADSYKTKLKGCSVGFGNVAQSIVAQYGEHTIDNLSLSAGSSVPTRLVRSGLALGVSVLTLKNSDLSANAIGALMGATTDAQLKMTCRNLKLHASTNFTDGACTVHNEVIAVNCHSGDAHIQMAYYGYAGSVLSDSTVYIAGAMQDGGTDMSRKMTPASAGRTKPLQTELLLPVADNATVQPWVEICSNVTLTDLDCWIDADIITTDATTLGTEYTTHPGLMASGTALTASSETWTNGSTYKYKIQLAASVVSRQDQFAVLTVNVANPSAVVYVGKYGT